MNNFNNNYILFYLIIIFILLFIINNINGYKIDSSIYPICSDPIYLNNNKNPDIFRTLYNCVNNITNALDPPSYLCGAGPVDTFQSFQFNNMISLSELEGIS